MLSINIFSIRKHKLMFGLLICPRIINSLGEKCTIPGLAFPGDGGWVLCSVPVTHVPGHCVQDRNSRMPRSGRRSDWPGPQVPHSGAVTNWGPGGGGEGLPYVSQTWSRRGHLPENANGAKKKVQPSASSGLGQEPPGMACPLDESVSTLATCHVRTGPAPHGTGVKGSRDSTSRGCYGAPAAPPGRVRGGRAGRLGSGDHPQRLGPQPQGH